MSVCFRHPTGVEVLVIVSASFAWFSWETTSHRLLDALRHAGFLLQCGRVVCWLRFLSYQLCGIEQLANVGILHTH
jgi:hypothetical protein